MLGRAGLRYLLQHPWQLILSILGVALGVAVVVAIDLANSSAERAFTLSAQTLSGRANWQIVAGPAGLPESVYQTVRLNLGVRGSQPVVEGEARAGKSPGRSFQLLGIDPLAAAAFHPYLAGGPQTTASGNDVRLDYTHLLSHPATGLLLNSTARQLSVTAGDTLRLEIDGRPVALRIIGLLNPRESIERDALENIILTDIATAQELLDRTGKLTRIDLGIAENATTLLQKIRAVLPPGASLVSAGSRGDALSQMTAAFRLNLTALSLLALLIGGFLIYNTINFSVIKRTGLFGMLRALGVTRSEIFRMILGEALLIALLGTGAGLLLGILLGQGLLHLVTRTINDLYFNLNVTQLNIAPFSLAKGSVLGVGATLLAAGWPAYAATRAAPRSMLSRSLIETRFAERTPHAALAGIVVLLASGVLLLLPSAQLVLSFAAMQGIMAGFALLTPIAILALLKLLQGALRPVLGMTGKMAIRAISASLSRSGVAIAALAIAISATIGVGIMIESFRGTVVHWLEDSLRADVYISPRNSDDSEANVLSPGLIRRIAALPGVTMTSQRRQVVIDAPQGRTSLLILDVPLTGFAGFQFSQGDTRSAWPAFEAGAAVLVSEPYAYHHGVQRGDRLRLTTPQGDKLFPVAGVFYDYGSSTGVVAMSAATYEKFWRERKTGSLGVYLEPGTAIPATIDKIRALAGAEDLLVRSNRALREASIAIFDRTFAITNVLRALTVLIAFIGVLSALMALQLERGREFATLRALGMTPRQLWRLVSLETGLMGLIAGILALPLGLVLAYILIVVINLRSFGWTMQIMLDPQVLGEAVLLAVTAALLAGVYPAYKMASGSPALALREE